MDFIKVKQCVPYECINLKKWKKKMYIDEETGETKEYLIAFIKKLKVTYSFLTQSVYIQGRIINLVEDSYYLNFDDFQNYRLLIKKCFDVANEKLNKLFTDDFRIDISQSTVTQIEYCFNIETEYKSEYIKMLNLIYAQNRESRFKRYSNFTVEEGIDLESSFYLKTKTDYTQNKKINFCLNIYDKQNQLLNKSKRHNSDKNKSKILADAKSSENILRIEYKAYYESIRLLCEKFKISNTLENLFDINIAQYTVKNKLKYFFGECDFYSKSIAERKINNKITLDLNVPYEELSVYKRSKRRKILEGNNICPYGFIPEDWNVEVLTNPINLIEMKVRTMI